MVLIPDRLSFSWQVPRLAHFQVAMKILWDSLGDAETRAPTTLNLVPQSSMLEFFLPIELFNLGKDSKNGCLGVDKKNLVALR